ncbi:MAG: hypothetical protein [Bacteriophage sp.]|jgi:hypothetical protein|nr:MAG: hypothetical protein [Bacteriophage sp.]
MKAIGIKMVELQPMRASMALSTGYKIGNAHPDDMGYEVTYPDGYKSWTPKDVADNAYFPLSENNNGTKILKEDVEKFITDVEVMTVGEKTTVVNAHTLTGFDTVRHSSCVDPKNYSEELGKQYAMEEVVNSLWSHLGFVLQWAKYGLNAESKKDKYPSHVQRMIDEYKELDDRINKLASFINTNPIFETLQDEEREDMKAQLIWMHKYISVLANRLIRQNVEPSKLLDK